MKTVLFIVVLVFAGVTWWFIDRGGIFPTEHRAYRFEVTVDTPEGLKTNYSVHETTIQDQSGFLGGFLRSETKGEAVPFVLEDGRVLFATLYNANARGFGPPLFALRGSNGRSDNINEYPERFDEQIPSEFYPRLAIIDAPDKPETIRMLDGLSLFISYRGRQPHREPFYEPDPAGADSEASRFQVIAVRVVSTNEKASNEVAEMLPWLVDAIVAAPHNSRGITDAHMRLFGLKRGVQGR